MKKIVALIIAVFVLALALVACGEDNKEENTGDAAAKQIVMPTDAQGATVYAADEKGYPIYPTDALGEPVYATDAQGEVIIVTAPDGKLIIDNNGYTGDDDSDGSSGSDPDGNQGGSSGGSSGNNSGNNSGDDVEGEIPTIIVEIPTGEMYELPIL